MPPEARDIRVKEAPMEKLVVAETAAWKERYLVLTKYAIFLAKDSDATTALDAIPLREIESVIWSNLITDSKLHARTSNNHGSLFKFYEQDDEKKYTQASFVVRTHESGYNSGRTYQLCCSSAAECKEWVLEIENLTKAAKIEYADALEPGLIGKCRRILRTFVSTNLWQFLISGIIVLSFILTVVELDNETPCEDNPEVNCSPAVFEWLDYIFTIWFCIDLLASMFVDWFWAWAKDGWNIYDFVVIAASLASDLSPNIPSLDILRLFRVFRIARVFKRFKGLRAIVNSLTSAVVPVSQSLVVLGVVISIYAVSFYPCKFTQLWLCPVWSLLLTYRVRVRVCVCVRVCARAFVGVGVCVCVDVRMCMRTQIGARHQIVQRHGPPPLWHVSIVLSYRAQYHNW
jgi:hypothetical protein